MLQRILQDQYQPLRVKGYQKPIPKPAPFPPQLFSATAATTSSDTPTATPKQPWEYDKTFKPPDHYQPALGYRPRPPPLSPQSAPNGGRRSSNAIKTRIVGESQRTGVAAKREQARKVRIFDAYEKTLDYKGGVHRLVGEASTRDDDNAVSARAGEKDVDGSLMAGQMRVYEGFIEEKIKKAREQGLFRNVKGRGKPLPKDDEEGNPYLSRDDFLINRILKSQDAAPPWIELQKELEHSLSTFRSTLSSSWIRRAVRIRASEGLTPAVITEIEDGWRDLEWERQESKYHETAVRELNDLTRRFNIIAPYHVRRPLLTVSSELSRTITASKGPITLELSRRLSLGLDAEPSPLAPSYDRDDGVMNLTAEDMGGEKKAVKESMWRAFRRVVVEVLGKPPDDSSRPRRSTQ
ncbi:hypothetical protein JCM3766R1_000420 [Sporobolomyces carnicolor]